MQQPIRFIHTADLHIGAKFKGLDGDKGNIRRHDLIETLRRIVRLVIDRDADGLLVVGDLFDERSPGSDVIAMVGSILDDLEKNDKWCVVVPGNHDHLGPGSPYDHLALSSGVTVVRTTGGFERIDSIPGMVLYATAYDTNGPNEQKLAALRTEGHEDLPVIVAVHGSYEPSEGCWNQNAECSRYSPISHAELRKLEVSYVALGHFHSYWQVCARPLALYPGSPEGLSIRESGERYVAEVTAGKRSASVERIVVNQKTYLDLPDIVGIIDEDRIITELEKNKGPDKILRLTVRGMPKDDKYINLDRIRNNYEGSYFDLRLDARLVLPEKIEVGTDQSAPSIFKRLILKAIDDADEEDERPLVEALLIGDALFRGEAPW